MPELPPGRRTDVPMPCAVQATVSLPIGQLQPSQRPLRRAACAADLELLAESLRHHGQLTPLWVRRLGDEQYEIVAGERRWRAAQAAGLSTLHCQVFHVSEDQAFVLALVEECQRRQLSPLEEAHADQEMLDRGLVRNRAAIARTVGVTRTRVTQRMKLLELDAGTQQLLREHPQELTESHGRLLLGVVDFAERHLLADQVITLRWSTTRLRQEIDARAQEREVARWQSGRRELPRSLAGRYAGFSFQVDLTRADLRQAAEVMRSASERLRKLAERQEAATAAG